MSDPSPASLAAAVAAAAGLPEPEPIRHGMSSLFACGDEAMVRVAPSVFGAEAESAWHRHVVALGVRVPRWLRPVEQHGGLVVTVIERIHPTGEADWTEVGSMVRRLHDAPSPVPLPWCGDFAHWQVASVLAEVRDAIDDVALTAIEGCLRRHEGWQAAMRSAPAVACHGDVHPGNVMAGPDGSVLIDWDMRCTGPAAWDHGPLVQWGERWSTRWGGGPTAYAEFAAGYGRSFADDPLGRSLADLRMVIATLMRVRAARTDPSAAEEAERRLRFWRGDPDAPRWEPQ